MIFRSMLSNSIIGVCLAGLQFSPAQAAGLTIDFDDLPTQGTVRQAVSLASANGGSLTVQGVTFDSRAVVVGDEYRIGGDAPNPTFGLAHSGHYFLTNGYTSIDGNDGLVISTSLVLTEAWFGRNEYYGYGGGSTAVTVSALGSSNQVLGAVSVSLPDLFAYTGDLPTFPPVGNGLPDPLVKLDASSFLALSGIAGYRVSRVATGPFNGSWVGDDFKFQAASVPEPTQSALLLFGLLGLMRSVRGQRRSGAQATPLA